MPDVVEPGTRLVQRYRLDERLGGPDREPGQGQQDPGATTTYWRAHDELLERPVGICLLPAGDEHAGRVLRAARKAAVLTDSRFLRVLDASEADGVVYVVSEWVRATRLVDLLRDGPLPADEARALALEVAGALAAAHDGGLAHLCLAPEHVLRTAHGQVKLAGLAVDAAARGIAVPPPAEASLRDTQAAAGLLYAGLTARWPGGSDSALPAAPYDGDDLCSPRQVRAGVPYDLDSVVCRALGVPGRPGGAAVRTPTELVAALAGIEGSRGTVRLPVVKTPSPTTEPHGYGATYVPGYDDQGPPRRWLRPAAAAWALVALLLLAGLGLAIAQLLANPGGGDGDAREPDGTAAEPPVDAKSEPAEPVDTSTLDPPPDGTGEENSDRAALAVDGDAGTAWTTKTYDDPFGPGGIKDGVGLVLDLGEALEVSRVAVRVLGGPTDLEVRVAQDSGTELDDFELLAGPAAADPRAAVEAAEPVQARYVLLWLTSLPPADGGYRGEVAEITVAAR